MTATARHARHGAITVAARQAITMAGPCEPGDVLGVVDGDFVVVGEDLDAVATDIVDRLIGGGGELVTLVAGRRGRRPRRALRATYVERAAPACRCRGVRRWPGALSAPDGRRVVRSSMTGITLDSPVAAVLGDAARSGTRSSKGLGAAHRRRPAAALPAPLPQDRRAHRRSTSLEDGQLLTVVGEIADSETTPTRTGAPVGRPTGSTSCSRTDGPSLKMAFFAKRSRIADWHRSRLPVGVAASSPARSRGSATTGS